MQDGAFSLTAPPVQGMPVQTALRTLHGVITGFKHLSSSQDEARYEVRLEPRMALLAHGRQNAIYQNLTVPQIVEKILRERTRCAVRTSCLTSKANTRPRTGDAVR